MGTFIRDIWHVAGWTDELTDALVSRRLLDEPVLLYRTQSGTAVAIADRRHRAKGIRPRLPDPTALFDHWIRARWNAPGLIRLDIGVTLAGTAEDEGIRAEGSHLLTPEAETTTHYFYSHTRNRAWGDPAEDERVREWHRVGFSEQETPMIEAVQRQMGGTDLMALKPVVFSIDVAAVKARRMVERLRVRNAHPPSAAAE